MRTAALIREARLRAGFTQRDLASRLGTTQSAIARWEAGRATPSLETLAKVASACGLDLSVNLAGADPGEASLIERTLRLTPEQRLDELVRTVAFIRAGRAALADQRA
jgi:transcriptional regulator with XRE-family HTH domain